MYRRAQKRAERHITDELLSAYLDGQVKPRKRGQVERHLRVCPKCTRELETLRYTTSLLQATPRVSVPRAFTLSEADVGRTVTRNRGRRLSFYLQGATAVVAALLLVVVVGDVLTGPTRYGAPVSLAPQKIILETVVVEAETVAEPLAVEAVAETEDLEGRVDEQAAVMEPESTAEPPLAIEAVVATADLEGKAEERVAVMESEGAAEAPMAKEALEEMVLESAAAAEPRAAKALAEEVVEKPAGAEIEALAATPQEEQDEIGTGGGGKQPQSALPAAAMATPTVAAPAPEEPAQQDAVVSEQPRPSTLSAPEATPDDRQLAPRPAAAPTAAPTPAPSVAAQPLPELLGRSTNASSWWTLPRLAETALGSLLVILLGLTVWLRRQH